MARAKIKTGVPGLDEIFKGGILENSAVLISGGPGTGKSILAMQFLAEGAKNNEPGLCILYDIEPEEYLSYADSLGIPLRKYEKDGTVTFIQEKLLIRKIVSLSAPLELIRRKNIKRVVLDSLTMFSYIHVADDRDYRMKIFEFLKSMKNVTFMATAEAGSNLDDIKFSPEDFLFDGLIFLDTVRQESTFERVIHVSKMRGQDHLIDVYPFLIGKGGIAVYPDQLPFALMQEKQLSHKARK